MRLIVGEREYEVEFDDSETARAIRDQLPIAGEAKTIGGGEIYFLVDLDLELESTAKEVFEVGQVVYWRSQTSAKKAIAFFFGNTPLGDGSQPRAASAATAFARILSDVSDLSTVQDGDKVELRSS